MQLELRHRVDLELLLVAHELRQARDERDDAPHVADKWQAAQPAREARAADALDPLARARAAALDRVDQTLDDAELRAAARAEVGESLRDCLGVALAPERGTERGLDERPVVEAEQFRDVITAVRARRERRLQTQQLGGRKRPVLCLLLRPLRFTARLVSRFVRHFFRLAGCVSGRADACCAGRGEIFVSLGVCAADAPRRGRARSNWRAPPSRRGRRRGRR